MKIENIKLDKLHPDPKNARMHPTKNMKAITASLKEFEQYKPIVVQAKTMKILAGNGTYAAALELGWKEIACNVIDIDDAKALALAITDNKTSDTSDWDFELLGELLRSSDYDFTEFGWDDFELEPILQADWKPPGIDEDYDPASMGKSITLTSDQRTIIDQAIKSLRDDQGDESLSEGRCIELICADYLAG